MYHWNETISKNASKRIVVELTGSAPHVQNDILLEDAIT